MLLLCVQLHAAGHRGTVPPCCKADCSQLSCASQLDVVLWILLLHVQLLRAAGSQRGLANAMHWHTCMRRKPSHDKGMTHQHCQLAIPSHQCACTAHVCQRHLCIWDSVLHSAASTSHLARACAAAAAHAARAGPRALQVAGVAGRLHRILPLRAAAAQQQRGAQDEVSLDRVLLQVRPEPRAGCRLSVWQYHQTVSLATASDC